MDYSIFFGGQFALFATTPHLAALLRYAASLRGNRFYPGRKLGFKQIDLFLNFSFNFAKWQKHQIDFPV